MQDIRFIFVFTEAKIFYSDSTEHDNNPGQYFVVYLMFKTNLQALQHSVFKIRIMPCYLTKSACSCYS